MAIPEVITILENIKAIHEKKNKDYASQDNQYENFNRAATLISWFKNDFDKTYVNHIATKLARLATLLNSKEEPNNESIEDSFLDLCTYCILWSANYNYRLQFLQKIMKQDIHVQTNTTHI